MTSQTAHVPLIARGGPITGMGLGIVPSNPLWRELSAAIISYGGNLSNLVGDIAGDIADRHGLSLIRAPSAVHPAGPAPAVVPGTGRPEPGYRSTEA
jgi:hypothetical protein